MDSNIDQLLEKYWKCETTLEEEQQLREFFNSEPVADEYKDTAALFRYFSQQKSVTIEDSKFDLRLKKSIQSRPRAKSVKMMFSVARIAAGIVVLIAAVYLVRQEVRKSYPPEVADTYTDPKVAFEETKKALMMISKGFGKAQHEAEKIKIFNEAEEKIQNDTKTEEKDNSNI